MRVESRPQDRAKAPSSDGARGSCTHGRALGLLLLRLSQEGQEQRVALEAGTRASVPCAPVT